ncbi:DUF5677 domain-containing protein [Actinobacillus equuli subsp. haemolyticus]|uniref:DUF5677 domain-containing protein n=1 Tax=Actinobacillus equuli TaxID=718 RepID=UPI002441F98A|nr:DUF5677 domain-containing protein [Actinobacillus equuli]WGE64070.1 DUF5677 domain-containing protein [Actinobacillus equuli subsp. haemolyticus]
MQSYNDKEQIQEFEKQITLLQEIGKKIIDLENDIKRLELDMNIHINYAAKLFSLRQFTQLSAMFLLRDNENIILISRSMFEGAVYLGSFVKEPILSENWRYYCLIVDQQRVDATTDKTEILDEVTSFLNQYKPIIDDFKKSNGEFYKTWTKGRTIKELSSIAQLEYFYKEYYSSMSDFHHWGTKSFGIRYKCLSQNIKELLTAEIKLDCLNAWCMAISSILCVLKILAIRSNDKKLKEDISSLENEIQQINALKTTSINYGNP